MNRLGRPLTAIGSLLAVTFFLVMAGAAMHYVWPWFGRMAWAVPAATEGCFLFLLGLGIQLERRHRPMPVLRAVPYLFAAGSLALQVYAAHGQAGSILAHCLVTLAFFIPIIAGEEADRRLGITDRDWKRAHELADARAYIWDLLHAELGRRWRRYTPSLLRRQLRSGRLPAALLEAIHAGADYGSGASAWQAPAGDWVKQSLPQVATRRSRRTSKAQRAAVLRLAAQGTRVEAIVVRTGVPRATVYRIIGNAPRRELEAAA